MEENVKNEPVKPEEEGLPDKAKKLVDKAEEALSRAKVLGKKLANKAAGKPWDFAENIKNKTKEEEKPENL